MTAKNYKTIELDAKYIPKKSEEYMCETQKAYFYKLLNEQREELASELESIMNAIKLAEKNESAGTGDEADNSNTEQDATNRLYMHDRANNLIKHIDAALDRLEKGTFGFSVISGDEIGLKRMLARPTATMTMEEQEEFEKK